MVITTEAPAIQNTPETRSCLTREQVVERIITINPTAAVEFLARFTDVSLSSYLQRLQAAQGPRGPEARWVRQGDTPGIMMAERN
jgi:hypothetical protein